MRLLIFRSGIGSRLAEKFAFPERLKGTFVEKWADYWKNLGRDYREVALDVYKGIRNQPRKAVFIVGSAVGAYKLTEWNPGQEGFMQCLRYWNNQLMLVSPPLQNPESTEYLRLLESAVNHNRLRFISLGILTLVWLDRYDANDCTYAATCDYTRVRLLDIPQHILDVGMCGKYWRLQAKMHNFDINYI